MRTKWREDLISLKLWIETKWHTAIWRSHPHDECGPKLTHFGRIWREIRIGVFLFSGLLIKKFQEKMVQKSPDFM